MSEGKGSCCLAGTQEQLGMARREKWSDEGFIGYRYLSGSSGGRGNWSVE